MSFDKLIAKVTQAENAMEANERRVGAYALAQDNAAGGAGRDEDGATGAGAESKE